LVLKQGTFLANPERMHQTIEGRSKDIEHIGF